MEWAINAAARAGVKKLILTHHDPERTDDQLDELEARYAKAIRARTPAGRPVLDFVFAKEGMVL